MKDALLIIETALPNANANNNSDAFDLLAATPNLGNKQGYILVDVPALSDHTNTSVKNLITMHHSAEASANFAESDPVIEIEIAGVGSTGSAAKSVKVPIPPDAKRYVKFNQLIPTNGGTGNNATVTYSLVVP